MFTRSNESRGSRRHSDLRRVIGRVRRDLFHRACSQLANLSYPAEPIRCSLRERLRGRDTTHVVNSSDSQGADQRCQLVEVGARKPVAVAPTDGRGGDRGRSFGVPERFVNRLGTFARVILFDKRGTGLSDRVCRSAWAGRPDGRLPCGARRGREPQGGTARDVRGWGSLGTLRGDVSRTHPRAHPGEQLRPSDSG